MSSRLLVLAALTVGGCASGDTTPLPGQEEAIAIIWHQTFGETKSPPPIYWRRDFCGEPNGIYPPLLWCSFNNSDGRVAGDEGDGWVEVGAPWGTGKISNTALAHELLHASIGDPDHKSPKWSYEIDDASTALEQAGL